MPLPGLIEFRDLRATITERRSELRKPHKGACQAFPHRGSRAIETDLLQQPSGVSRAIIGMPGTEARSWRFYGIEDSDHHLRVLTSSLVGFHLLTRR